MAAARRATAIDQAGAASVPAPATDAPEPPAAVTEPQPEVGTDTVAARLEQAQKGLLAVVNNAVSPDTGHGVDILLAKQAAETYQILVGESR